MVMPLLLGIESEGGAMVHEKQTKNEESAAHLNQTTDTGTVPVSQGVAPVENLAPIL